MRSVVYNAALQRVMCVTMHCTIALFSASGIVSVIDCIFSKADTCKVNIECCINTACVHGLLAVSFIWHQMMFSKSGSSRQPALEQAEHFMYHRVSNCMGTPSISGRGWGPRIG